MSIRASVSFGRSMSKPSRKTRATAEARTKECHSYKPLRKEFRRGGFNYRQIARERDIALYEQVWTGCVEPSPAYEVIRIRRREGFQIGGKFVDPAEVYPPSELWGANGFTFADHNKAWESFLRCCWKNQQ